MVKVADPAVIAAARKRIVDEARQRAIAEHEHTFQVAGFWPGTTTSADANTGHVVLVCVTDQVVRLLRVDR